MIWKPGNVRNPLQFVLPIPILAVTVWGLDALLGMKHTSLPPWCCSAGAQDHPSLVSGCCYRNAQVEPQQHGMIVQEYEQDRHVRATVGKQESWLGDH